MAKIVVEVDGVRYKLYAASEMKCSNCSLCTVCYAFKGFPCQCFEVGIGVFEEETRNEEG